MLYRNTLLITLLLVVSCETNLYRYNTAAIDCTSLFNPDTGQPDLSQSCAFDSEVIIDFQISDLTPAVEFSAIHEDLQKVLIEEEDAAVRRQILSNEFVVPRTDRLVDQRKLLVFQVNAPRQFAANRITYTEFDVALPKGWKIEELIDSEDVRSNANIGTVVDERSSQVSAGVEPGQFEIGGEASRESTATTNINPQDVVVSHNFKDGRFVLRLRARYPQITIEGRYQILMNISVDPAYRSAFFVSEFDYGDTQDADKVMLGGYLLPFYKHQAKNTVTLGTEIWQQSVYNSIDDLNTESVRSYDEGDDDIVIKVQRRGTLSQYPSEDLSAFVIEMPDIKPDLVYITIKDTNEPIKIKISNNAKAQCLFFAGGQDSSEFLTWLRSENGRATGGNGIWTLLENDGKTALDLKRELKEVNTTISFPDGCDHNS